MIPVKDLITELQRYPPETLCCGYEGESYGVLLKSPDGFIETGSEIDIGHYENGEYIKDRRK